ncbi:MAG: translation initiation factor IF-2, partial [Fervidicoccaceae archaeon]
NNVIYRLLEDYFNWRNELKRKEVERKLESLVWPAKVRILPGFIFRRSDPAIVGIEVLGGILRPGAPLMTEDGKKVGVVNQLQDRGQSIKEARVGMQIALSIKGNVVVGRHINEGDIMYTDVPDQHARMLLTELKSYISEDSLQILNEIIKIKRKTDPLYAFI